MLDHEKKACHCYHNSHQHKQIVRETAGAQSRPAHVNIPYNAMESRTVGNAVRCCVPPPKPKPEPKPARYCAPAHPFKDEIAGTCDIGFTFRADVDLCEEFFPRPVPNYPPYTEPPCGASMDDDPDAFMIDKGSGVIPPIKFSPCFESWMERGYQRER